MNKIDRKNWYEKTLRLNANNVLKVGDKVVDIDKNVGIVVRIDPGIDFEDHGTMAVWQSERYNYGGDNCEHYCEFNWKEHLRIIT